MREFQPPGEMTIVWLGRKSDLRFWSVMIIRILRNSSFYDYTSSLPHFVAPISTPSIFFFRHLTFSRCDFEVVGKLRWEVVTVFPGYDVKSIECVEQ